MAEIDTFKASQRRMGDLRETGYAQTAHYDSQTGRIVINLNTGVQLAVFPDRIEGLANASVEALSEIEITPSGLGLHWPQLDADVYLPALLQGIFGSTHWMAARLGAIGGHARSASKTAAARENGKKGGRPRKHA